MTIVEGNPKAPFSIATTPRCRGGRYSFPGSTIIKHCYLSITFIRTLEIKIFPNVTNSKFDLARLNIWKKYPQESGAFIKGLMAGKKSLVFCIQKEKRLKERMILGCKGCHHDSLDLCGKSTGKKKEKPSIKSIYLIHDRKLLDQKMTPYWKKGIVIFCSG